MNVFGLRNKLVGDYATYVRSFLRIRDVRIQTHVERSLDSGYLWPDPLIQLNPSFEPGDFIDQLVEAGILHKECARIFRKDKSEQTPEGAPLHLHRHQSEAIRTAAQGHNYVLTTGTGSGKSLAYIIPIVDRVLREGTGRGVRAIVVYPMNALANSQHGELTKFLTFGYADRQSPVRFERYTGQETLDDRERITKDPPDILLTNYVMLELMLTRPYEQRSLIEAAKGLRFLVLDELHTYRGRQGADVAMLVRRTREASRATNMQYVGTSATLAGPGSYEEQRTEVARVASLIFGATVQPEHVVGETIRRATWPLDLNSRADITALQTAVQEADQQPSTDHHVFVNNPLSSWVETTFGIKHEAGSGRLIRATPKTIRGEEGGARSLSLLAGLPEDTCRQAIERTLLKGYEIKNPATGFSMFAFRLHQFISRGESVYTSLEAEAERHLTLDGQQFVPGGRDKILLPLVFCRECGQEYYCVWRRSDRAGDSFEPRDMLDRIGEGPTQAGFVYVNTQDPWPNELAELIARLPDEWIEERNGVPRIKQNVRNVLPEQITVTPAGRIAEGGMQGHFIPAPFRLCLHCGVTYDARQRSDAGKLESLGLGGRSTATTILSLSAIMALKREEYLHQRARKLLSFTDNRQDASLQAGHLNDFVEIGLLRSALYRAAKEAGPQGLTHEVLAQRVAQALNLPLAHYASDPDVRYHNLADTNRAFCDVLGYRLYLDLRRGWRVTSPNLEQCGLLEIRYSSLDELCADQPMWDRSHPALVAATPETRKRVARVLMDFMRRSLAINVSYLDAQEQERIKQRSFQRLREPWAIDENERREVAPIIFPRAREPRDYGGHIYLSPRGGFGQYLRRSTTFQEYRAPLRMTDSEIITHQLLNTLRQAGIVTVVEEPQGEGQVPGYQITAAALNWVAGDGTQGYHDVIRVPRAPEHGFRANPFFVHFYREAAGDLLGLHAHEHTAQVNSEVREEREKEFREARLPILYCSPTMELGVDIAELNVVNMRNVPPTPANYAQRSGRAGRSGQPALVFTYCSTGSSHDQYFFRRPWLMVSGAVTPPRLDLANEDLIRAHVQAIWLAETREDLGSSLKDILDVSGEQPALHLIERIRLSIENPDARNRAKVQAERVLTNVIGELERAEWYGQRWLDEVIAQVGRSFDVACERWRSLYRAARAQYQIQTRISVDASRPQDERERARMLRREAESQLDLLTQSNNVMQSDFYSYRYLASEGFLPGYSFPRLPISAFIPGRRAARGVDEFLSRPRFLAISEFGPRGLVYHEGSQYMINKVILPVDTDDTLVTSAVQCQQCGYFHPLSGGLLRDRCERCNHELGPPMANLLRLQNVSTKRRNKINSDEEERVRLGYELRTGIRFAEPGGRPSYRTAVVREGDEALLHLQYGHTATIWRINLGWSRREDRNQLGFVLDIERGYWESNRAMEEAEEEDPLSPRTRRVVPYVEDRRNCLLIQPEATLTDREMASLEASLKAAIEVEYQLEDSELATEPLPSSDARRLLLIYESAEGGAGVLRRLLDDPQALGAVANRALELCHFTPEGQGAEPRPGLRTSRPECEAACYNCLMSYRNQRDHRLLDRKSIESLLRKLARSTVIASPVQVPRSEHLAMLLRQAGSQLERDWLNFLETHALRLPTHAQHRIEACRTKPDFFYQESQTAVYIDGPPHDFPDRQERDRRQTECMEDRGYTVVRFQLAADWTQIIARFPHVFGGT